MAQHFPQVTLLITHYNRSSSLKNLLTVFHRQCSFGAIIVSDDGSLPTHLKALYELKKSV